MLELVLTLIVPSGVGSRCHLMSIADVRRRLVLSGAVRWVQSLSDHLLIVRAACGARGVVSSISSAGGRDPCARRLRIVTISAGFGGVHVTPDHDEVQNRLANCPSLGREWRSLPRKGGVHREQDATRCSGVVGTSRLQRRRGSRPAWDLPGLRLRTRRPRRAPRHPPREAAPRAQRWGSSTSSESCPRARPSGEVPTVMANDELAPAWSSTATSREYPHSCSERSRATPAHTMDTAGPPGPAWMRPLVSRRVVTRPEQGASAGCRGGLALRVQARA